MGYTLLPTPSPSGLSTERPASAQLGFLYLETDTKRTYQWNGTTWCFHSVIPDPDWINASLLNGWVNYTGFAPAGYRRLASGLVLLRGLVRSGTVGAPIFILPPEYRCNAQMLFDSASADMWARGDIYPDGRVIHTTGGNSNWFELAYEFMPTGY